jgi:HEAT repeat protein
MSSFMSFYPELDCLNLQDLIKCFQGSPPVAEDSVIYYTEVAILITKQHEAGIEYLYNIVNSTSDDQLRGIIFALTESPKISEKKGLENREKLRQILFTYLNDERPMIIAEAIDGLSKIGEKKAADNVLKMLQHSSPYVRGSVLRFLTQLLPEKAIPILLDHLKDPHFIVRENAVDELGEIGTPSIICYLQPLLSDSHPDVRQAAQTAIDSLS